jgi:hypothetical protein
MRSGAALVHDQILLASKPKPGGLQLLHKFDFPSARSIQVRVDDATKVGRNYHVSFAQKARPTTT